MSPGEVMAAIEELGGKALVLKLAREHGGTRLYVSDAPRSEFVEIVGEEVARKLVIRVGAGRFMVPMSTARGQRGRAAAAAELIAKGVPLHDVALACDIHLRTAERIKASVTQGAQQPDLFRK